MDLSSLHMQLQALQMLARPGNFAAQSFQDAAFGYQAALEDSGVPAGYMTPVLDLLSDPRVNADHTASQAFLESLEGAGLLIRPDEDVSGFRDKLKTLTQGRLSLDSRKTISLIDDESRAHDIAPTYQLLRPLSGLSLDNAAEVWLAHDQIDKRMVALKMYRTFMAQGDMPLGGLLNELRFQSSPPQERIVRAYQAGRTRTGDPYLGLEWMEGGSVQGLIDQGRLSPQDAFFKSALSLARQMVEAVAVTHQCGILHRDIKPANFFATKNHKNIKLGDFGIAIREEEFGLYAAQAGTSVYMPPELVSEDARDGYTRDVYSLGLTLYEFLTGLPTYRIRSAPQIAPSRTAPQRGIPQYVDTVILRAMDAVPGRRYPNAVSMMEDVEALWPA